ncbi:cytochrome P450 [Coniella lustricola]|uniref:Cytochrome P450 n=1 Tax=Coniella lustricola TaxID=2025994 RepID=A0A2T3A0D3_9PEZI|nr:cytochrome P450 [Coniella lustricola]
MAQALELITGRLPVIAAAILVCAAAYLLPRLANLVRLYNIPVVGKEIGGEEKRRNAYLAGARKLYNDGYKKFKDTAFRISTSRTSSVIVLPPKYLPELSKLPDTVLSMTAAVDESMETKYLKIDTYIPVVPHLITRQLTPALIRLNPMISREVSELLKIEIPPSDDWKEYNAHDKLLRIITQVSGRLFVGPELSRNETYIDTAINYTMDVMKGQRAVQKMRPWKRPFMVSKMPEIKNLYKRIDEADAFLAPLVTLRKKMTSEGFEGERPDDMLQWLIDAQEKFDDPVSRDTAKVQLGLTFAAIHTTTLTAMNAFYNLAASQEFVGVLRQEIEQVLADNDGLFTSRALQAMKKLDSFLKETLRMNPATMAAFQRKVLQPFSLTNGQQIPAGVTVEVPAVAVNFDPTIFPEPERFDPLRFTKVVEQAAGSEGTKFAALNQFVSVNQNSLTFGYGRHACPGRFFAANEIKMLIGHTVLHYDIKLVDGVSDRYPNLEFAHMSIPDPSKNLLFRKRTT